MIAVRILMDVNVTTARMATMAIPIANSVTVTKAEFGKVLATRIPRNVSARRKSEVSEQVKICV